MRAHRPNPAGEFKICGMHLALLSNIAGGKGSLRRKALFGSQWLLIGSSFRAIIDLVKTAIFARILFPEDYGIVALAMMAIGLLESFSTLGIDILIQRDDRRFVDRLPAFWTIKFVRGLLLSAIAWWLAIPLAHYYGKPELVLMVRFLSLTFFFNGCAGFGREVRQRRMDFSRLVLVESITHIIVFFAGLLFLFALRNAWALVIYSVIYSFGSMIVSYALFGWRPSISFDRAVIKSIGTFSASIVAINILNYFFSNFDKGVIGKLMGIDQLGFYTRAYFLALVPMTYIFNVVSPVFLPTFNSLARDQERFRRAFIKSLAVLGLVSFVIGALFFLFSRIIVIGLYGERWLPVLPVFQILILFGITKGIVSVSAPVFFIVGKPWLITLSTAVMVAVFGVLCVPMTSAYNLCGTAWTVVIAGTISHTMAIVMALRQLSGPTISPRSLSIGSQP